MVAGALALAGAGTLPATAEAACAGSGKSLESLSTAQVRTAVQCLINQRRSGSLKRNKKLQKAAQRHSSTMAQKNCILHQCSGEPDLGVRIKRAGYLKGASAWAFGENIAGLPTGVAPRDVVSAWMKSPGHKANIRGSWKHFGVGYAQARGLAYLTVDFGWRRG